jgi:hypothetical protein
MDEQVIYYPYIRVPQSNWFTRVLLYWDKVGAIVPYDYIENPERLGHYMVGLVREGLVTQVIPGIYLGRVPNFSDAFINYVDQRFLGETPSRESWSLIHMEKLQQVGNKLCERGLARKSPSDNYSPWYEVEPRVAGDFMAYLAAVLGQISEAKFCPITDQRDRLLPFKSTVPEREPLRKAILRNILPTPARAIEPERLAEFKAKHRDELRRFRIEVEDRLFELSGHWDDQYRNELLQRIVDRMRENIRELTARMQEQKGWPHIELAGLCAIVSSGLKAWQAAEHKDWKFGLPIAALGLGPVVWSAFHGSDLPLRDKPFAYACFVEKELVGAGS